MDTLTCPSATRVPKSTLCFGLLTPNYLGDSPSTVRSAWEIPTGDAKLSALTKDVASGELPILFAVCVTGTILAVGAWPLPPCTTTSVHQLI